MSPESSTASASARSGTAAARRRVRETEIISATRQLFDERGVRDAQIEDIARAVGINRAIVYRHFTGKEELFALTLVEYLDELRVREARRRRNAEDARRLVIQFATAHHPIQRILEHTGQPVCILGTRDQDGVRIALTIVDTPGFGDNIDNEFAYVSTLQSVQALRR